MKAKRAIASTVSKYFKHPKLGYLESVIDVKTGENDEQQLASVQGDNYLLATDCENKYRFVALSEVTPVSSDDPGLLQSKIVSALLPSD